jgi:hypothetical protein
MDAYKLKIGFLIHLLGSIFYNATSIFTDSVTEIHLVTSLIGLSVYVTYTYLYKLTFIDINFAKSITPNNYSDTYYGSHKLISYGFSTFNAIFLASFATLYLFNDITNYTIKQVYFISMSYYLGDLYYVIDSTNKLTKLDYFTLCHHTVMILMYYVIFILNSNSNNSNSNLENTLLYYMNRGILAEYSVLTLNYSWYLVNTKQDNSNRIFISSLLTLVLYFITRVINFTVLIYNFWSDDLIPAIVLMMPLFLINYYWFYKLLRKAYRILSF